MEENQTGNWLTEAHLENNHINQCACVHAHEHISEMIKQTTKSNTNAQEQNKDEHCLHI